MNIILININFKSKSAFDKEQDSLNILILLNGRHPNIDVFISGINNQNLTLQTYLKSTYTGLLINFESFT